MVEDYKFEYKIAELDDNFGNCSICLNEINPGHPCKSSSSTECSHIFHTGCLDKWLEKKNTSPMCRCIIDKPKQRYNNIERIVSPIPIFINMLIRSSLFREELFNYIEELSENTDYTISNFSTFNQQST